MRALSGVPRILREFAESSLRTSLDEDDKGDSRARGSLADWQKACTASLAAGIQMKQEAYMTQHPEVKALLETFVCKVAKTKPHGGIFEMAAKHFTRPVEELDREIRQHLKLPPTGPYFIGKKTYSYTDDKFRQFLQKTKEDNTIPPEQKPASSQISVEKTQSSTFSTLATSDTTLPTPEPVVPPDPTISEHMFGIVSGTVDNAIFLNVDVPAILYDTAYVEVINAVEEAMEVPVIEVREDIAGMLETAYKMFELNILEKEKIAHDHYLATRMRRTEKKTLREIANFKGYAPPSATPTYSAVTSTEVSVQGGIEHAHLRLAYNRYAKDRFGVYRSVNEELCADNMTTTPPLALSTQESTINVA